MSPTIHRATGSLLRYGSGALSFNHNLYADNYSGSPRLGDNLSLDFVNNVIYNWGLFSGLTGGTNDLLVSTDGCTNQLNYVCNYLIAGPDTASFRDELCHHQHRVLRWHDQCAGGQLDFPDQQLH